MLCTMKNSAIQIKLCQELYDCISLVYSNAKEEDDIPDNIINVMKLSSPNDGCLSVNDMKWLYSKLPLENKCNMYKYLEKSEIILPQPEVLPRNPELQARIEKLKIIAAEKQYQSMTKNVDTSRVKHPEDTIASQLKEMNRQLIAVLQLILSVSAGFVFGFLGIQLVTDTLDNGTRIFLGLFCAGIILIAELYFLIKNLDATPKENPSLTINSLNSNRHQE